MRKGNCNYGGEGADAEINRRPGQKLDLKLPDFVFVTVSTPMLNSYSMPRKGCFVCTCMNAVIA